MIEIQNVTKTYQTSKQSQPALKAVNLSINKGEIFGIIGKSGAGKSTLIRTLNLLERPTSGEILIDGINMTRLQQNQLRLQRREIGMIFQHFNLFSSRNVFANIAYPLEIASKNKEEINKRVYQLIDLVGLQSQINHYPDELSGGQKQRVAIARALALNPKVLLCDEATSALDPQTTKQILNLLKKINQTLNITIVLITHEMEVVRDICHRVAIIDDGQIAEYGNVIDVFTTPKTDIAKTLTESTMKLSLPDNFRHKLIRTPKEGLMPVLKLTFLGSSTQEPIIATLTQKFDVIANLLQANIDLVQNQAIGISICQLLGEPENITQALEYIHQHNIQTEVLGYAAIDAF
ncbi:methionine ABC transporter ATP-binding protein [Thiotrichales bacterium 19S9-12]|nr:methionine ABC transporter ATP-binding protein [Thiotrichales bacterium 19S9-11]MCF6810761.1 methionine ABC transporter ATP-binding protein [Thiotrichales bacterium 19S9-12]